MSSTDQSYLLSNGAQMPAFGLGTWKIPKAIVADLVYNSIVHGVRHFDCACDYGNEVEVGIGIKRAIDEHIISREDLWVTSKLWNTYHSPKHVKSACLKSLSDMGLEYFDLYLVHFPISLKFVPFETRYPPEWLYDPTCANPCLELNPIPYSQTWTAMEDLVDEGLVRNLGAANLVVQSLMEILSYCRIKPVVNQVELHPYLIQAELIEFSKISSIHLTAYSPLGSSSYVELNMDHGKRGGALEEPIIQELSEKYSKTPAQILLRWNFQRGVSVIPKSSKIERIQENRSIFDFDLTAEDIDRIESLNCHLRFNNPGLPPLFELNDFCPGTFCKKMGGALPIFG